jgi:hypothetical protein
LLRKSPHQIASEALNERIEEAEHTIRHFEAEIEPRCNGDAEQTDNYERWRGWYDAAKAAVARGPEPSLEQVGVATERQRLALAILAADELPDGPARARALKIVADAGVVVAASSREQCAKEVVCSLQELIRQPNLTSAQFAREAFRVLTPAKAWWLAPRRPERAPIAFAASQLTGIRLEVSARWDEVSRTIDVRSRYTQSTAEAAVEGALRAAFEAWARKGVKDLMISKGASPKRAGPEQTAHWLASAREEDVIRLARALLRCLGATKDDAKNAFDVEFAREAKGDERRNRAAEPRARRGARRMPGKSRLAR